MLRARPGQEAHLLHLTLLKVPAGVLGPGAGPERRKRGPAWSPPQSPNQLSRPQPKVGSQAGGAASPEALTSGPAPANHTSALPEAGHTARPPPGTSTTGEKPLLTQASWHLHSWEGSKSPPGGLKARERPLLTQGFLQTWPASVSAGNGPGTMAVLRQSTPMPGVS